MRAHSRRWAVLAECLVLSSINPPLAPNPTFVWRSATAIIKDLIQCFGLADDIHVVAFSLSRRPGNERF